MDEVQITSIIREVSQGMTAPYLCDANDNNRYVVKGSKASTKELMYEWIVANLAAKFGLPIPPFKKAFVDQVFTQYNLYDLYNYNFASQFQDNIQEIRFDQLAIVDANMLKDLYFFDYWVQNGDRTLTAKGGNPNFFLHQITLEPYVLDHNLAFDKDFSLVDHRDLHLGAQCWNGLGLLDKVVYEEKLADCLAILDEAIGSLPKDWLDADVDGRIQTSIKGILNRVNNEEFWEGIK
jgi:hypothetical protein